MKVPVVVTIDVKTDDVDEAIDKAIALVDSAVDNTALASQGAEIVSIEYIETAEMCKPTEYKGRWMEYRKFKGEERKWHVLTSERSHATVFSGTEEQCKQWIDKKVASYLTEWETDDANTNGED